MAKKPTYEELQQRAKELEKETVEHKRAEEALRVSLLAWHTLFDAVTDSVFLIDSEGKILLCNKATANFLGKPINEIVGNTCWELVHGTSEPIKGCPIVRMRETRHSESLELPVGDRVFYVATHPILDQDGNIARAVHIITDITERKQAEEERKRLIAHLRQALSEVKTLTGLFPICMRCKKVRDDEGYWHEVEEYIRVHSDTEFSHGYCPECGEKWLAEIENWKRKKKESIQQDAPADADKPRR